MEAKGGQRMAHYRSGSHTVYDIKYHFVWITKYRYKVLQGNVAIRLRELLRQGCDAKGLEIVRGSIGREHVHMPLYDIVKSFSELFWQIPPLTFSDFYENSNST